MQSSEKMRDTSTLHARATTSGEKPETLEEALQEVAHLLLALEHRTVIGEAVGIVMERHHVDAETAFAMLSRFSQQTNTRVHELACRLVRGDDASGPTL
jgi:AmiR/NasT family two-component response regulator